ncbi:MurR/RpiR family transcriptional regulator [Neobacillus sp. PS3-40]|jgi:RpiR family transcriptional regulator, carbohydrate utilization regulator|uniref:MurR/RpiR family transcriptional regulator n=1 Tax=Neobacillus sp. PS3-40 TaxID=3070679 RepID=UPI0027DF40DE|nr:MurR/RpiR family transcriptional regulator [Neobacillus sp. PS3-40]WML43159.1 MurR/RpiR family transcriptional regulator [Neobacillus sp. PS3-40]
MTPSYLGKIRSYYARLSEKEKKIANYILDNPDKIIHCTINEVAEDLNVADATVFRFCKRLGFKGYQAMKIALASEVVTPMKHIHEEISDQDNEKAISEKIFKSNIRTLENTLQILDYNSLQKAVQLIQEADRVEFYGTGGSVVVAIDAFHKFIRSGVKAFAFPDSHFQLMSASQLTKNDVAVVISHTGTNNDTIKILNTAIESGAKTIGITSFPKSPISQNVDVALYTSSDETEYRSEALASRIAQLSLIDALYVNLMILNKDKAKNSLEKVRNAISETRI